MCADIQVSQKIDFLTEQVYQGCSRNSRKLCNAFLMFGMGQSEMVLTDKWVNTCFRIRRCSSQFRDYTIRSSKYNLQLAKPDKKIVKKSLEGSPDEPQ